MKFKRFTKPSFLKEIGRELLGRFFERFNEDLSATNIVLPAANLEDDAYFKAMSQMAVSPDGLPDNLFEAIYAIEGMANAEGQERLERAVTQAGLPLEFNDESTHADIAVQVWMADPALFAEKHNEQRLHRLSTFEYFACKAPVDRRQSFTVPDEASVARMVADMDEWFPKHNRGAQTTHVEVYAMDGECWFLIRHGDTYARMPTAIENRRVRVLHFRPTKDDVVVYSPERDEIRIHAGTKGEKELYVETFGVRLFGDDKHFSERKAYTLEPLRADGPAALDTDGIPGISEIVLREIEWAWDNGHHEVVIRKADDIFAAAADRDPERDAIPQGARLVRAKLDFYFGDSSKARWVEIRPPNILKVARYCDVCLVHQWIVARGFRVPVATPPQRGGITHVATVAEP